MRALGCYAVTIPLLFAAGCASLPATIDALAKDPASVCLSVTTIYGQVRIARTALPSGRVTCTSDGLTVVSPAPAGNAP